MPSLAKGKNSRTFGLRYMISWRTVHLQYFMSNENDVSSPAYKFIINDERIFAPVNEFVAARFITKDTASLYYNAILLLQNILKFHFNDVNKDALLDADLARLAFANEYGVFANKTACMRRL